MKDIPSPRVTCAVTGAGGYLGSQLVTYLETRDIQAVRLTGKPRSNDDLSFSLGSHLPPGYFQDRSIDALVHTAWDFSLITEKEIFEINVQGSIDLFRRAASDGVKRLVFISTMSAFDGCKSLYGKAKLAVEREVSNLGGTNIRPGLIYGLEPRGMVGTLTNATKLSPILPMIGSGSYVLYLIHEADLSNVITHFILADSPAAKLPLIAADPEGFPFRAIVKDFAKLKGRNVSFIPVPWRLIWLAIRAGEAVGLKLPFRSDSVLSLVNQALTPDFSELLATGIRPRSFASYLKQSEAD